MPVTKPKAPVAATRYPPAAQPESGGAGKKKKKKKGKGKIQDTPGSISHPNHVDHDVLDDDDDELGGLHPAENDHARRAAEQEYENVHYSTAETAPLNSSTQAGLRMSTTATAQAELLAAANELYKRMETEQLANESNDGEYWKQLPSHIRSFVETTYAHGAALSPNERSKSQAMLALAQTMVDEATSRFPAGAFPPPFDPSLLSDPKFAERLGMKHGARGAGNLVMRDYADEVYDDDYVSENDEDDLEDEQQYEADELSKKKKKKKKKNATSNLTNGVTPQTSPLPQIIPSAPNPAPSITRAAPSVAQPRPSSRAAGKQPVYSQPTAPPARSGRGALKTTPAVNSGYTHGSTKASSVNGNSLPPKRPNGGGGKNRLWSNSSEEERERIKEFWLGLSELERRDLVKLEKEAVLKKMKEQQKHSCSCAVCGRKRNAIEEELEVLYDAYYEELEQYANHQQQYQSSGGKITPPPGPGPFPGSVALDKNGSLIGAPGATKHPTKGAVNGVRGRKAPPGDSEDEYDDDDYDDDDEYDDEDDEDDEDEDDDDSNTRKMAARRRGPQSQSISRRANGRDDFFRFGNLTAAGPGNILTVADDLLKNDGAKFLEMMEQLAERRMQREEDAAKEVEVESDEDDEDPEGSEDDEDDDVDNEDESEEEEEDPMSEEQKMEEGRKMFSIFAARMFEQRVLNAYREKVAAERQEQLLRELADEDKVQAERDAKRQKENQKKKDKKKQQKQAKEAEKAKKEAEKAAEEAATRAKAEAQEEEQKKRREEDRQKREAERKQKEEEKARLAEERRLRIAEQKAIEDQRKREREERERKERVARQEKEALVKAERAEREKKAKEERLAREAKDREEREKRDKEERERREKQKEERERQEQLKSEEKKKQDANKSKSSAGSQQTPTSPRNAHFPANSGGSPQVSKKPSTGAKLNGPTGGNQRAAGSGPGPGGASSGGPSNRPPPLQPQQQQQQQPQGVPIGLGGQRSMLGQGPIPMQGQLPPNMGIGINVPQGMQSYNPMVNPQTLSPRSSFGPPSATGSGPAPFSPMQPYSGPGSSTQPLMGNVLNGTIPGNIQFGFDTQPSLIGQPPMPSNLAMPSSRPQSAMPTSMPPGLTMPSKAPGTPITNGMGGMSGMPLSPILAGGNGNVNVNMNVAHMRRASAQATPSPFGAIGKPSMGPVNMGNMGNMGNMSNMSNMGNMGNMVNARAGPSSVAGDDDRSSIMTPPSPSRPLGSSALVDENDTIVELPKRRGTTGVAPGIGGGLGGGLNGALTGGMSGMSGIGGLGSGVGAGLGVGVGWNDSPGSASGTGMPPGLGQLGNLGGARWGRSGIVPGASWPATAATGPGPAMSQSPTGAGWSAAPGSRPQPPQPNRLGSPFTPS